MTAFQQIFHNFRKSNVDNCYLNELVIWKTVDQKESIKSALNFRWLSAAESSYPSAMVL